MSRAFAFATCAALAACTPQFDPCFDPDALVTSLRILGVRVDPPEALADLAAGSVEGMQARILIASGVSNDQLSVGARACAPLADAGCAAVARVRELAPLEEGVAFPVLASPALLIKAALADALGGFGGIQLRLEVAVLSSDGSSRSAYKTLLYSPAASAEPVNHGFEISGLRVRRLSHAHHELLYLPTPPDDEVLPPGSLLRLDKYDAVWLRPQLAPGPGATEAAELYETTGLDGRRVQLRERITYRFYVTPGNTYQLNAQRTFFEPFFDPAAAANEPEAGADPVGVTSLVVRRAGQGTLWVVARDSRGAQAWLQVPWVAQDATLNGEQQAIELGHHCAAGLP